MLQLVGLGVLAVIFVKVVLDTLAAQRNARKAAQLGALPPPQLPNKWWDYYALYMISELFTSLQRGTIVDYIASAFDEASARAGRKVSVVLGRTAVGNLVITHNPKVTQAVLATQFKDFDIDHNRINSFKPLLGTGIFTTNGPRWQHSRALLKPAFNKNAVADVEVENRHCRNLMRALPVGDDGWTTQVDLQKNFFRLTLDSSTEFLFGQSVLSQLHELPEHLKPAGLDTRKTSPERLFAKSFDFAQTILTKKIICQDLHRFYFPFGLTEACKHCHDLIDHYVRLALEADPEKTAGDGVRYNFLGELAKETRDPLELRYELLNILLAGRDTTAGLLGFLFSLLARHPDEFQKLRTAIIDSFGPYSDDTDLSFGGLKDCSYLQYCLNEALRLYPSVPFNFRSANRDTTIPVGGGADGQSPVFLPKGTTVFYSVAVMHRSTEYWGADAAEFKPERWRARKIDWSYLPFNGGPRICLGQQFALTSAGFSTVKMLQRFDGLENLNPERILVHTAITASPQGGVPVRLHEAREAREARLASEAKA